MPHHLNYAWSKRRTRYEGPVSKLARYIGYLTGAAAAILAFIFALHSIGVISG